jgi:hypothetical protein
MVRERWPFSAFRCLIVSSGLLRLREEGWNPNTPCQRFFTPQGEALKLFSLRTEEGLDLEFIEEMETADSTTS